MERIFTRLAVIFCMSVSACTLTTSNHQPADKPATLIKAKIPPSQDKPLPKVHPAEKVLPSEFSYKNLKVKPLEPSFTTTIETSFMIKCLEEVHYLQKKLADIN
jgi:hypothetical protein